MSEKELIILAAQGDEHAFNQLYEEHDGRLAHFIYSRVNNAKEAEDLLAIIWEKIILHLKEFEGKFEKSFQSWIFTVARNTLFNYYKSHHHNYPNVDLDAIPEIHLLSQEGSADFIEQENIRTLINTLPKHQSQILQLRYFEELKNKEIAVRLDISEKTVAAHLSRALKNLFKKCSN